jgi:hypothetical protein
MIWGAVGWEAIPQSQITHRRHKHFQFGFVRLRIIRLGLFSKPRFFIAFHEMK